MNNQPIIADTLHDMGVRGFSVSRINGVQNCSVRWNRPPTVAEVLLFKRFVSELFPMNVVRVDLSI